MLETVGLELIKMMGHSGTVPGSLAAADIAGALAHLEQAVASAAGRSLEVDRGDSEHDNERELPISIAHRALPLIEMLKAALQEDDYVIWDR